ncbi:DUF4259 domain-containing protein [Cytophagaceae bacterium YF14B1]|uniref:DUF4259 domain-containing protein n=1 Tax=Xanthocytophaga flava TaxID=3048013 RepID=A0AAE3UA08_9BACT|nr:DUF4259 domain-containing protein [Xanthocytophaga flavus]MDJ1482284.1 DUF4259 domain-containing protein [Xanthocytophaga flavus]
MGSWGIKALESDEGLDILDFFTEYTESHSDIHLGELIDFYIAEGFLPADTTDIDYLYDKTAIALAELFTDYQQYPELEFGEEKLNITSFTGTQEAILYLIRFLEDILNEKPDEDGIREYAELYREVKGWKEHMQELLARLNAAIP